MVKVIPKVNQYEILQGICEFPIQLTVSEGTGGQLPQHFAGLDGQLSQRSEGLDGQLPQRFEGMDGQLLKLFEERVRKLPGCEEFRVSETREEAFLELVCEAMEEEAYQLKVTENHILLKAGNDHGFSNGLVTLFWLVAASRDRQVECCRIEDRPGHGYRGFMLDVCRHFFPVDEVKRVLEQMALLKLDKFHFHLSDDQGFRIESRRFPELNVIGSVRRETYGDGIPHGGFYTQEELRELVEYAAQRYIEVIPEIDLPGHTTAIIASYPEFSCSGKPAQVATQFGIWQRILCAGKEETYAFLEELLGEICGLFPSPYFHIGGDEAPKEEWTKCPDCGRVMREQGYTDYEQLQAYFTGRLVDILKKCGKQAIGWNETVYSGELDPSCITQYWQDDKGESRTFCETAKGRKFICSNTQNFYFDYPYATTPMKATYWYEPNIKGKAIPEENVLGVEAPLWTESVQDEKRLEHMIFPRMGALAENAWTMADNRDFEDFLNRLKVYNGLQDAFGIHYAPAKEALIDGEAAVREVVGQMARWAVYIIEGKKTAASGKLSREELREELRPRLLNSLERQMSDNYSLDEIAMAKEILMDKIEDILAAV